MLIVKVEEMTDFFACSKREDDLLGTKVSEKEVFTQRKSAYKKDLEAPVNTSNFAAHELVAEVNFSF